MEYTYTIDSEGTWNPGTHQYTGKTEGRWTCDDGADQVTVTNHSNAAVDAAFTYEAKSGYESIDGSFNNQETTLKTAEDTEVSEAPNATATLSLTGALKKDVPTATTIGTATVTLNAAN